MKRIAMVLIMTVMAMSLSARSTPLSLGFNLSDNADNFAVGLEVSSPSFAGDYLVVRAKGQVDWLSSPLTASNPNLAWEPFSSYRLGLAGCNAVLGDLVVLYGEFGGLAILPASGVSDDDLQMGIYGLFGFEFFMDKENAPVSYFLEAGSNGFFDTADKLLGNPDYYGGFTTRVGCRFYF